LGASGSTHVDLFQCTWIHLMRVQCTAFILRKDNNIIVCTVNTSSIRGWIIAMAKFKSSIKSTLRYPRSNLFPENLMKTEAFWFIPHDLQPYCCYECINWYATAMENVQVILLLLLWWKIVKGIPYSLFGENRIGFMC